MARKDRELTETEAAELLGMHPASLARRRLYHQPPAWHHIQSGGRKLVRYWLKDIEAFKAGRPTSGAASAASA